MSHLLAKKVKKSPNHAIHEDSQVRATVAQAKLGGIVVLQTAAFPAHL